jgi:hypothetical protein
VIKLSSKEVNIRVKFTIEDKALQQAVKDATDESVAGALPDVGGGEAGGGLSPEMLLRTGMGSAGGISGMGALARLAPLLGPAVAVLVIPVVFDFVIKELSRPGGPWDTKFRRAVQQEEFGFYNRQLQHDMQYGYRNVIIQGVNGFKRSQGAFHASAFRDINEGYGTQYRLSRVGITDKALGFWGS